MTNPSPNYLQKVRDQYEDYPYPRRDPEEEKLYLRTTFYDALDILNYYCYEGKQNFQNGFRVLVAGGGTGDATIYLAEQLRHTNAEIVYVDISTASMAIAKKRAEIRGLTNITWVHDSLLEVGSLGIGQFDYINSSGVLHHLADPAAGLRALASVLKEDGAMGIMVYGEYGRTGVYHMQQLMRILGKNAHTAQDRVDICKEVLASLPPSNWFALDTQQFQTDITTYGDIGVYDLFLHSQDRAYSLPQLYEWIEGNGLTALDLIDRRGIAKCMFDPRYYIKDATLLEKTSAAPLRKQQEIAELAAGHILMHTCFMAKTPRKKPTPDDVETVPTVAYNMLSPTIYKELHQMCKAQNSTAQNGKFILKNEADNITILVTDNQYSLDLLRFMDGKRTIKEIIDCLFISNIATGEESRAEVSRQFSQLFYELNLYDWLLLRDKSVPQFKTRAEMQKPILAKYAKPH